MKRHPCDKGNPDDYIKVLDGKAVPSTKKRRSSGGGSAKQKAIASNSSSAVIDSTVRELKEEKPVCPESPIKSDSPCSDTNNNEPVKKKGRLNKADRMRRNFGWLFFR